tara:strand:+ start:15238 stop:15537 length:300 start_codon:yes stop_codon:yes gene_type:complete
MPYLEQNLLSQKGIINLSDKFKDLAIPSALNFKSILSGGTKYKKIYSSDSNLISNESFDNLLKNVNPNDSFSLKSKSKKGKGTKRLRVKSKISRKKFNK